MIEPCMVSSWLYCSGERNCRPGRASSARISMAMNPAATKKPNDVTRYMTPICLASVVRSNRVSTLPFGCRLSGPRNGWIGTGRPGVVRAGIGERFTPLSLPGRPVPKLSVFDDLVLRHADAEGDQTYRERAAFRLLPDEVRRGRRALADIG